MMMLRSLPAAIAFSLFVALAPVASAEAARDAVMGCWIAETGDSILHVRPEGESLVGQVVSLNEPTYGPGEREGMDGQPRKDYRNPDPKKRDELVLGMNVLEEFAWGDEGWGGNIYDPASGSVYTATLSKDDDGRLHLRGYVGFSWLGRSVYYVAPEKMADERKKLLEIAKVDSPCTK